MARGWAIVWLRRWERLSEALGADHAAAQAALGRSYGHSGRAVPQRSATGPAAVAWHRASGAQSGYRNRRYRRHLAQL